MATIEDICAELNHGKYCYNVKEKIKPRERFSYRFLVALPAMRGSYPLVATASYINKGQRLSLKHVALFNYMETVYSDDNCSAEYATINKTGYIKVKSTNPHNIELVLPDELIILSATPSSEYKLYKVTSQTKGLRNKYPYSAYIEDVRHGRHRTSICQGTIDYGTSDAGYRGIVPPYALLSLSMLFLFVTYHMLMRVPGTRVSAALVKYTSRMFLVAFSYYILQNIGSFLELTMIYINNYSCHYILSIIMNNFRGSNYNYFFKYFIDLYMVVCLTITYPYLYYYESNKPVEQDKYVSLLRSICSLPGACVKKSIYWNKHSKSGLLTYLIKLFYVPYLTSWVINNSIHQKALTMNFQMGFFTVNEYLVALFIYIDTLIFAFGYLIESRIFKNEIKSVEPAISGWIVCLWCYPPFNEISFKIFDHKIIDITYNYPQWVINITICIITILWGVFAWASVSMGTRASNLTNRGIVRHGPYKYVRHPAYTAKIIVWFLQGIFMGQYGLGILSGFLLIYVLRALTEERHLSLDKDYLSYKKSVKWKFIPKII